MRSNLAVVDPHQPDISPVAWNTPLGSSAQSVVLVPLQYAQTLSPEKAPQLIQAYREAPQCVVPLIQASAHAGVGGRIQDEYIEAGLPIPQEWLRGVSQSLLPQCFLTQVVGDSMGETAPEGAYILAAPSTAQQELNRPALVQFDGALSVKRLKIDPKTNHLRLVSDNPAYKPFSVPPQHVEFVWRVLEVLVEFR
ncbi:MAG: S24 family peptidase [Vampirovibrionales bacterium]